MNIPENIKNRKNCCRCVHDNKNPYGCRLLTCREENCSFFSNKEYYVRKGEQIKLKNGLSIPGLILELYYQGFTPGEIAFEINVTESRVVNELVKRRVIND